MTGPVSADPDRPVPSAMTALIVAAGVAVYIVFVVFIWALCAAAGRADRALERRTPPAARARGDQGLHIFWGGTRRNTNRRPPVRTGQSTRRSRHHLIHLGGEAGPGVPEHPPARDDRGRDERQHHVTDTGTRRSAAAVASLRTRGCRAAGTTSPRSSHRPSSPAAPVPSARKTGRTYGTAPQDGRSPPPVSPRASRSSSAGSIRTSTRTSLGASRSNGINACSQTISAGVGLPVRRIRNRTRPTAPSAGRGRSRGPGT
jgi:hypothetical protein